VNTIKKEVDPNANIIFGSAFNEDMKGKIRISVVATGIDENDFYNNVQKDDPLHAKSQMVHEIRDYNQTNQENDVVKASMQGKKTFFDTGDIVDPDQCLSQISEEILQNKNSAKVINEEIDIVVNVTKNIEEEYSEDEMEERPAVLFEDKDIFDNVHQKVNKLEQRTKGDLKVVKLPAKKETYKTEQKKLAPKKEGFSLFGFMNSGSKNLETSTKKDLDHQYKLNKKHNIIIEDEEIPISKTQNHSDFANNDVDDMLNIPAFFRRKN